MHCCCAPFDSHGNSNPKCPYRKSDNEQDVVTVLLAEVLASDEDDIDEEGQQYLEKLAKAVSVFVHLPAVVLL